MTGNLDGPLEYFKAKNARVFLGKREDDKNIGGNVVIVESETRFFSFPSTSIISQDEVGDLHRVSIKSGTPVWTATIDSAPVVNPALLSAVANLAAPLSIDAFQGSRPKGDRTCMHGKLGGRPLNTLLSKFTDPEVEGPTMYWLEQCHDGGCFDPGVTVDEVAQGTNTLDKKMTVGKFLSTYAKEG